MMSENSYPTPNGRRTAGPAVFALAAALLFGATTPLSSIIARSVSPLWLSAALYLGVAALIVPSLAKGGPRVLRADLPWLAGSALVGGVAAPVLFVFGLAHTDAASASLLLAVEPVATALIAWLVVREHAGGVTIAGMVAIAAGAFVLAWRGSPSASLGSAAVLAAAVGWGIDNNLAARMVSSDAIAVTGLRGLAAACVSLTLALTLRDPIPALGGLSAGAIVGLIGYGMSLVFFMRALRGLGAARTGAYFATAPFVGALMSLAIGEPANVRRLAIAGALMAIGVALHASERHDHDHLHETLDHEHPHVHDDHHRHDHAVGDPIGTPHVHRHRHTRLVHRHAHAPDPHHHHAHG